MSERQWFAVRCKPRQEFAARHELERQGFTVYLPQEIKLVRHARRMERIPRPFFPGYLFLHLAPEECRWTAIRSTPGAIGAVHFGACYPAVQDVVIEALRGFEGADGFICHGTDPVSPFESGERIIIREGQFSGIEGLFLRRSGEERAMVLLDVLHRQVKAKLPLALLKSA